VALLKCLLLYLLSENSDRRMINTRHRSRVAAYLCNIPIESEIDMSVGQVLIIHHYLYNYLESIFLNGSHENNKSYPFVRVRDNDNSAVEQFIQQ
jgi:hypothetical protein